MCLRIQRGKRQDHRVLHIVMCFYWSTLLSFNLQLGLSKYCKPHVVTLLLQYKSIIQKGILQFVKFRYCTKICLSYCSISLGIICYSLSITLPAFQPSFFPLFSPSLSLSLPPFSFLNHQNINPMLSGVRSVCFFTVCHHLCLSSSLMMMTLSFMMTLGTKQTLRNTSLD